MKLPESVREQFRRYGKQGGKMRAQRTPPRERSAIARRAAIRRWTETRFGRSTFAELGLPGGDLIDRGLQDLAEGKETIAGLLVSLASSRLKREGVPLPASVIPQADRRLYCLLEGQDGPLAHARYLAYLRQVSSFADACRLLHDTNRRIRRRRRAG